MVQPLHAHKVSPVISPRGRGPVNNRNQWAGTPERIAEDLFALDEKPRRCCLRVRMLSPSFRQRRTQWLNPQSFKSLKEHTKEETNILNGTEARIQTPRRRLQPCPHYRVTQASCQTSVFSATKGGEKSHLTGPTLELMRKGLQGSQSGGTSLALRSYQNCTLGESFWAHSFNHHHETLLSLTAQACSSTQVSVGPENSLGQCCCQTAGSQRIGPKCMRFWASSRGTLLINSPLSDTLTFHAAVKLSPFMLITRENHHSKQLVYKFLIYAVHPPPFQKQTHQSNSSVESISIKYKILTQILFFDLLGWPKNHLK